MIQIPWPRNVGMSIWINLGGCEIEEGEEEDDCGVDLGFARASVRSSRCFERR